MSSRGGRTWPGKISVDEFLRNNFFSEKDVERARENLNNYYVLVSTLAKTRCIDGRHDPDIVEANLGPQVPGGAPGAALAYRLGVDGDSVAGGSFLNDSIRMIDTFIRLGLAPGGHRDEVKYPRAKAHGFGTAALLLLLVLDISFYSRFRNLTHRFCKISIGPQAVAP